MLKFHSYQIDQARRLLDPALSLPGHFRKYVLVSKQIITIIKQYYFID